MPNVKQPRVSVALCTYNGERFLARQLDSLLDQDYPNLEIIAVDDCSQDSTWQILQAYHARDQRLQLRRNPRNLGYARNFEKAIGLCSGDYIALADQDDIWEKDKLKVMVASFGDNVMVYHDSDFIDEADQRIGESTMSSRYRMYQGDSCLPFMLANCISGHATMFRRDLVKYLFPFCAENYHDWWISYVAFNVGGVKFVDKVLVHYRQHPCSVTDALALRKEENVREIKCELDKLRIDPTWLDVCCNYPYNKNSGLIKKTKQLFSDLRNQRNRFKSLIFLTRYYDLLFYICGKRRGLLSKLNYARKICFR